MNPETRNLESWGWNDYFAGQFEPLGRQGYLPGRITLEFNQFFRVQTEQGELLSEVAGRLKHEARSRAELPAVGDWVAIRPAQHGDQAVIHAIVPRRGKFTRKVKGTKTDEQVIAANVDTVFLMTSLNQDFNLRRLERYLSIAWESGARPVILLTKSDLCTDLPERLREIAELAPDVPCHAICAIRNEGMEALNPSLSSGQTVALIGSSGVGKSTLLNRLLGREQQKVKEIREFDDRGSHTTRHRELIRLPNGALILDTPGMREVQLWEVDEGVEATFEDIEELAGQCRFGDCRHQSEPACAVREAVKTGQLSSARLENYRKLQEELRHLEKRRTELKRKETQRMQKGKK